MAVIKRHLSRFDGMMDSSTMVALKKITVYSYNPKISPVIDRLTLMQMIDYDPKIKTFYI